MNKEKKQIIHVCPKCHSIKTVRTNYGFKCGRCGAYFPQSRLGNEKKEVEVRG